MLPLTLEITDKNGIQWRPSFRNLRFAKTFYGGEDLWMGFVLDRAGDLDHPDVAYGNEVVLRHGLTPRFIGEMRQIDSDLETVTPKVLGNWILLDDESYGGEERNWQWEGTPTVVRLAEDVIGQLNLSTGLSADKERAQELLLVRDAFTDPNNTSLHVHIPDIDKQRSMWTEDSGDWDIQSNQANVVAVAGIGAVATIDAGISNGLGKVDMYFTTTPSSYGLVFRYLDLNNFWALIAYSTGLLRLWRVEGGVGTFPWTSGAGVIVAGLTYELMARVCGSRIELFLDGVRQHTEWDAFGQAHTRFGMVSGYATCRFDDFEVCQAPPLWPLVFEDGQTCFRALEYTASFGDELNRVLGWGVESGGNRIFVRRPDASRARYVIPPYHASQLSARGQTDKGFVTEAWGKYTQAGTDYLTGKHYAFVTQNGIEVAGNSLLNPGFEKWPNGPLNVQPNNWADWQNIIGGTATNNRESVEVLEDRHALRVQANALSNASYKGVFQSILARVSPGVSYTLEAWVKNAAIVNGVIQILVNGDVSGAVFALNSNIAHAEYTKVTCQFTPLPADTTFDVRLRILANANFCTATAYFDKFSVFPSALAGAMLASDYFGAKKSAVIDFGDVPLNMAEDMLRQYLVEHGHPQVQSSFEIFGPVQDRFKGGAWIQPYEMEMGYLCQIPRFRAVEVEGIAGSDLRDWDTTFLLVGMQYDAEKGRAKLIPEGASEDLERMLKFVKEFGREQEKQALQK